MTDREALALAGIQIDRLRVEAANYREAAKALRPGSDGYHKWRDRAVCSEQLATILTVLMHRVSLNRL